MGRILNPEKPNLPPLPSGEFHHESSSRRVHVDRTLVVIAILIGLLLPAVQKVREATARIKCANNLKQIGLALHNYESSNSRFPPAGIYPTNAKAGDSWSALTKILPYIEQANTFLQVDFNLNGNVQDAVTRQCIPIFLCPSETCERRSKGAEAEQYVGWYDGQGRRHSESCGPGSRGKNLAEKRLRRIQSELDTGVHQPNNRKSWTDFQSEYETRILSGLAPRTRDAALDSLGHFTRINAPTRVQTIKTAAIDEFVREGDRKRG